MALVDSVSPRKALGLGAVLSSLNPKNLLLVVGAAAGLAQLGLASADAVVALAVFVVVGSLGVLVPVGYFFLAGERAAARLDDARSWLAFHGSAIVTVLLLVFGVLLVATGLGPLGE